MFDAIYNWFQAIMVIMAVWAAVCYLVVLTCKKKQRP